MISQGIMKDTKSIDFFQSDYLGHSTLIQFPYLYLPSYKEWPCLHIDYFWKLIQHRVTVVASGQGDWEWRGREFLITYLFMK